MKFSWRNPFFILGLVLLWRLTLFLFTAQPIPANDAFVFDGGVANWLKTGHYVNPCIEVGYPISSSQVFSIYPPLYQVALLAWMPVFGASSFSLTAMHLIMCAVDAFVVLFIIKKFFPGNPNYGWVAALLLGITFNDRPDDLAHGFGLCSLGVVAWQLGSPRFDLRLGGALVFALLLALFTSVLIGAVYFGAGFLACAAAGWMRRRYFLLVPFFVTAALFAAIVVWVIEVHPLWWQGFLENGRKQSVVGGFHKPYLLDLFKVIRTAPVFLVAIALLPWIYARRSDLIPETWSYLVAGALAMGSATLFLAMTLIAPDYVSFVIYLQMILAAGLLVLTGRLWPWTGTWAQIVMLGCVLMVSIRAAGMTTWGVACAWKNSYWHTRQELRTEFAPFEKSDAPVVISSAYLYSAVDWGVRHPIHSDWYYDRALAAPDSDIQGMIALRPPKLVLTQFDYYRGFATVLNKLRQHPELLTVRVRDLSAIRTPDSIPALQRVIQHISWAPVIVDLDWKSKVEPGH